MASDWSAVRVSVGFRKVPLPKKKEKKSSQFFTEIVKRCKNVFAS
jgi:hypothetical protein